MAVLPKIYEHDEALGLSEMGTILRWDKENNCRYDTGVYPEDFDFSVLTENEAQRLGPVIFWMWKEIQERKEIGL